MIKALFRKLNRASKTALVFPIRLYQKYISPQFPRRCNYYPTCSRYAVEAIEEWGVFIGSVLALWRLLRCNPFSYGGYDPVPKRKGREDACAEPVHVNKG